LRALFWLAFFAEALFFLLTHFSLAHSFYGLSIGDLMDAWGNFWQKNHSTTFAEYYPDGYTSGYVADWWSDILQAQNTPLLDVLEVGCGNASLLPRMLDLEICGTYTGVDAAAVELSAAAVKRSNSQLKASLIGGVAIEAFQCQQKFDIVASVYGIEYSPLEQSLPVVKALLSEQGKLHLLIHHAGSVITAMSAKAMGEFDFALMERVITDLQVIDTVLVKYKGDISRLEKSAKAQAAREKINQFISSVMNVKPSDRNPILLDFANAVLVYFKKLRLTRLERKTYIESILIDFHASKERFRQMVNVARDDRSIGDVEALLQQSGFNNISVSVLTNQGEPVAWNIKANS